jgi:vancomycin permeability regulator SanA
MLRYVIAMIVAIVVALLATLYVSPQLASMAVDRFTFDSPDEVGTLEDGVYMLSNFAALLIGWTIGWLIGGRFGKETAAS